MQLENEKICVEISEHGAELTRIYNKESGDEILWEADPKFWKRHAPVLFPNVGKTYHNTVLINGVQYPTCQHGFARDSEFELISATKTSEEFLLKSSEETRKRYPFDFELRIGYELEAAGIRVKWTVYNPSSEPIYFTVGGHPAFRFAKGDRKEDYILRFPGKRLCIIA